VRLQEFWSRLDHQFGTMRAQSVARTTSSPHWAGVAPSRRSRPGSRCGRCGSPSATSTRCRRRSA